ncbi:hypothetical protein N7528_009176 [Penicillium herquei]|nr:hypothetical protein N7528_009176 [Penicillium herquei]
MAVRLDVNLFDANEEKTKKTNCVPLKDFDIAKKTLSDVRTALIDNGGLDASSVTGAKVNDSTLFVDYLEILSENAGEEEEEEDEEKEKDDKTEKKDKKEKSEKSSKVTVHNVYIISKDKKSTDRKAEAKELIKKELNLKLSVLL